MRTLTWAGVLCATVLGVGCGPAVEGSNGMPAVDLTPVTASEADALRLMREEEKLAHDVYVALEARWHLVTFSNIASSEQRHMDAVANLLVAHGIEDPAAGNAAGVFTDPRLQTLHDELVAKGSGSLDDALIVGATIEDLDLFDLARLTAQTTRADVLAVWATLSKGSRNHLRSFESQLAARGVTYTAQFLDAATYQAIVGSEMERGP
jgi:hypothetical protein